MHLPELFQHASTTLLSILGALSALKRLFKAITPLYRRLPKHFGTTAQTLLTRVWQGVLREIALPKRYLFAEAVADILFIGMFYVMFLYTIVLTFVAGCGLLFGHASLGQRAAGLVAFLMFTLFARWCFAVAERTRLNLRAPRQATL